MASITHSKKSKFSKTYDLYTQQPLYKDTSTISIKVGTGKENAGTGDVAPHGSRASISKASEVQDNEGLKTLQNIVGCDDAAKVAKIGRFLLKLYAEQ